MARLPDVPDAEIPSSLRALADAQVRLYGTVLHSLRQTAHAPHVALGQAAMSRELSRINRIDRRLNALLNLRVAAIVGCPL
ncbi:MAG: hypothetical protein QJR07_09305 [Acetobacteraceae bacterium]|nr:hypothetical protein [Acetobacteraceae bacterium]MDI3307288.1 hypothetical protein [Acetobacteraceae bacterium]